LRQDGALEVGLVLAGAADTVAVLVHGVVGGRWAREQLHAVELPELQLFGDADVGRRVFYVTWHVVTAVFVVCAATLYLMAFDAFDSAELLRLVAALHLAFAVVAIVLFARRLDALAGRVPPVFAACMGTVTVACWLASR
jgi:hypothetical protein